MDLALPNQSSAPSVPPAAVDPFLARVDVLIDWSRIERGSVDTALPSGDAPPTFAIKIALLKHWYDLGDQEAYFQLLDRLSFRAFVGFIGDGGASDARILDELADCAFAHRPAMVEAIAAVEAQLRADGLSVRCGRIIEPSLVPCTESGAEVPASGATSLFRPGELGRMVEAVTAKAHADGIVAPAPVSTGMTGTTLDAPLSALAADAAAAGPAVRAVLEWPWGTRTELTEHLNIGRDFQFSPFATELTPYTHVSRKHAELLVYGDGVWVRDLGSRNGTFVNDEEVPKGQAYLIDADSVIRFGPLLAVNLKLST